MLGPTHAQENTCNHWYIPAGSISLEEFLKAHTYEIPEELHEGKRSIDIAQFRVGWLEGYAQRGEPEKVTISYTIKHPERLRYQLQLRELLEQNHVRYEEYPPREEAERLGREYVHEIEIALKDLNPRTLASR